MTSMYVKIRMSIVKRQRSQINYIEVRLGCNYDNFCELGTEKTITLAAFSHLFHIQGTTPWRKMFWPGKSLFWNSRKSFISQTSRGKQTSQTRSPNLELYVSICGFFPLKPRNRFTALLFFYSSSNVLQWRRRSKQFLEIGSENNKMVKWQKCCKSAPEL